MNPRSAFDVVACINLRRREDRWEEFVKRLPKDWPFVRPRRFPAVDGKSCPPPEWWKESEGAWGCYRSHLSVIEDCLNNGRESVLILEDDSVFPPEFTAGAMRFLEHLPDDWQMLYLGGQLLKVHLRPPLRVNDEVYRPFNVNRNHAWALRGEGLRAAYRWLSTLDWYVNYHLDHHLGRLHERREVPLYAPRRWLVGQLGGASDISGQTNDTMFWNHPEDCHRRGQSPLAIVLGSREAGGGAVARALLRLGMFLGDELGGTKGTLLDKPAVPPSVRDIGDELTAPPSVIHTGGQATSATHCQETGGAEDARLSRLCQRIATPSNSGLPLSDEERISRLGDWAGHHLWRAECVGRPAAVYHPNLEILASDLIALGGPAIRCIRVQGPGEQGPLDRGAIHDNMDSRVRGNDEGWERGNDGERELLIRHNDPAERPGEAIDRLCNFLSLAPTPVQRELAARELMGS